MTEKDNPWANYLDCMVRLETQIKLVAFHTLESARYAREASNQANIAIWNIREYLNRQGGI